MYYWKIWRETRARFFALLILGLCLGWLLVWTEVDFDLSHRGFVRGQAIPPEIALLAWKSGARMAMGAGGIMLYLIGLFVGSSGLGEEMERGTASFLLTRPRPRGYFVWSFWLAGVLELLAFTAVLMLSGYATLFYCTRQAGPPSFLLIAPPVIITGLLGVGLAYFLATLTRSGKTALAGGVAFGISYVTAAVVLKMYDIASLPTPVNLYSFNFNAALAGSVLSWLTVAVAFMVLSHAAMTRLEV